MDDISTPTAEKLAAGEFIMELKPGAKPNARPRRGLFETYVNGGTGTFRGTSIRWNLIWHLFESQGPMVCRANLLGQIIADAGDTITFDAIGFFKRHGSTDVWSLSAGIKFATTSHLLRAFNDVVGSVEGTADLTTSKHLFRVHLPGTETDPSSWERQADHA